jgi:hypothetical protein
MPTIIAKLGGGAARRGARNPGSSRIISAQANRARTHFYMQINALSIPLPILERARSGLPRR